MIIPAAKYKSEIETFCDEHRYDQGMLWFQGTIEHGRIDVLRDDYDDGTRWQWAIVDKDKNLVGYMSYRFDPYARSLHGIGLYAFTEDHKSMAFGILEIITIIRKLAPHRIEFRAVSGNPAIRNYDRIVKLFEKDYSVSVMIYRDIFRDIYGEYHSDLIYELIER